MKHGMYGGGVGKGGRMEGTRVTDAHKGETEIAGSPQKGDAKMKDGRVAKAPGLPRKNDPPKKAQNMMGLKTGARVTSKEVGRRR